MRACADPQYAAKHAKLEDTVKIMRPTPSRDCLRGTESSLNEFAIELFGHRHERTVGLRAAAAARVVGYFLTGDGVELDDMTQQGLGVPNAVFRKPVCVPDEHLVS